MSEDQRVDVDHIGEHCTFGQCNRLDFLPVRCEKCKRVFCKEHYSLIAHKCAYLDQIQADPEPVTFNSAVNAFSCHLDDCKIKEIIEFRCEFCTLNFCKLHRFET